jgi:hydroxyethylthiazole kinase-like sugar kinase family protein
MRISTTKRFAPPVIGGGCSLAAAGLVTSAKTEKSVLLAAIEASISICAQEAQEILGRMTDADDVNIVDAVHEAMAMTGGFWVKGDDENEDDEW